ncbi:MAG TPA: hypothetical protein VMS18_16160 [Candidatus Binatia bacterium]|nr:hypothetical protein [Candidatus Binatia bacterium]
MDRLYCIAIVLLTFHSGNATAQTCQTTSDMDATLRTAIANAADRYFGMAARGDTTSLRQNSIPALASDFAGVENTLKARQQDLSGAQANIKSSFLLNAENATPNQQAEFWCGVFNRNGQTASSAAFYLNNLPPGKYAVVLMDANSSKGRTMFSQVLQQAGTDWKLGGLYIKSAQIAGHDSDWFVNQARQYKAKGQVHNAWFYYLEARSLISPLPFMSTLATDKLYDESQPLQPTDLPAGGKTAMLVSPATTYRLTGVFPEVVGNDLDLIVKYESGNVSNTNVAYQDNINVMKALVTKFPEVRDAFAAVVARAVDTSGRDYGTLLAMKDIK